MEIIKLYEIDPASINYLGKCAPHLFHNKAAGQVNERKYIDVCISVTGYAGGNKKDINDGLCFYTIIVNDEEISESVKVEGSRNVVRRRQTDYILNRLLDLIK